MTSVLTVTEVGLRTAALHFSIPPALVFVIAMKTRESLYPPMAEHEVWAQIGP